LSIKTTVFLSQHGNACKVWECAYHMLLVVSTQFLTSLQETLLFSGMLKSMETCCRTSIKKRDNVTCVTRYPILILLSRDDQDHTGIQWQVIVVKYSFKCRVFCDRNSTHSENLLQFFIICMH
jgi:hypothetical protein